MQWNDSPNAGFTRGTPWIRVNPNYTEVNAAAAMADPDSTFYYFQKLIRLRKAHPVIVHGRYELLERTTRHCSFIRARWMMRNCS